MQDSEGGLALVTRFVLGMTAAGLWIAAAVAVVLLARHAPSPAPRSIRTFRRARRSLRPPSRQADSTMEGAPPAAGAASTHEQQLPVEEAEEFPATPPVNGSSPADFEWSEDSPDTEMAEMAAVLDSITAPAPRPQRLSRRRSPPQSAARPKSGVRKKNGVAYVLVDDEGIPLV